MDNLQTITVTMQRKDLCDIMLTLSIIQTFAEDGSEAISKWNVLRNKLKTQLNEFEQWQL